MSKLVLTLTLNFSSKSRDVVGLCMVASALYRAVGEAVQHMACLGMCMGIGQLGALVVLEGVQ